MPIHQPAISSFLSPDSSQTNHLPIGLGDEYVLLRVEINGVFVLGGEIVHGHKEFDAVGPPAAQYYIRHRREILLSAVAAESHPLDLREVGTFGIRCLALPGRHFLDKK